ncbi:MAG: DoxX family membrane protein [Phycisphaeraceae bacterium]|nr:DoxX family membrane protein [Phycisphaeraceae bacterium]
MSTTTPIACADDGTACPPCVIVKSIATLARYALGALFIFSGAVKLQDPQAFAFAIKGFKIITNEALMTQATFAVPWTEVLIGVLLVLGLFTRAAAGALLIMLAGFTAAVVSVLARDIDTECGCFGRFLGSKIDQSTIIRNAMLLIFTFAVFYNRGGWLTLDSWRQRKAGAAQAP